MKNKFRLWLNIVTICLCVCAIAIGVYAATSATLTISGQIGFEAHGVDVTVTGYISGHASGSTVDEMKNGTPVDEPVALTYTQNSTQVSSESTPLNVSSGITLNLGDRYFSDINSDPNGKPTDITVVLNFSNKSKYNVVAKLNSTTAVNANVYIESSQSTVMDKESGSGEMTFKFSLKPNAQGQYEGVDLSAVSLSISFEKTTYTSQHVKTDAVYSIKKFSKQEASAYRDFLDIGNNAPEFPAEAKTYMERFPYYVEMGFDPVSRTGLRWLVVGKDDNGSITSLEQDDFNALEQGFMLNDSVYYLLAEKILDTDISNTGTSENAYGISFQNNFKDYYTTATNKYGISANDYATSNIRDYLKGKENVMRSSSNDGNPNLPFEPDETNPADKLVETYGLDSSMVYSNIKARSLEDLYADIITETSTYNEANRVTAVPTSKTSEVIDTTDDKFWLLSLTEIQSLFALDKANSSHHLLSAITVQQGTNNKLGMWWLRSAGGGAWSPWWGNGYAYFMDGDYGAPDLLGVRPVCKI